MNKLFKTRIQIIITTNLGGKKKDNQSHHKSQLLRINKHSNKNKIKNKNKNKNKLQIRNLNQVKSCLQFKTSR